MDMFDVLDAELYERQCSICGSTWKQTLNSEASKTICSVECADEDERRRDEWRRTHVCDHPIPYCCMP